MSNKTKKILKIVGLVFVGIISCGLIMNIAGVETDLFDKDLNKDNLIVVNDTYVESQNKNSGVEVEVDDDGVITLKGTAAKGEDLLVQSVELKAGTYTVSGLDDCNKAKFCMYVQYNTDDKAYSADKSATFTLESDQIVNVYIYWGEDQNFGELIPTKVYPTLVEGEEAGDFYA